MQANWHKLYQNLRGTVYQCSLTNRFIVEFANTRTSFSVLDFRQFRRMVNAIDMRQMALQTDDAHDVEILSPPHTDRCFVLTLCEVVHLRDLLNGTGFMLDLHRMLNDCGCYLPEEAEV